jgi:hypothetical protein
MKYYLTLILCILSSLLFSQEFEKIINKTDTFYVLKNSDSLKLNIKYPNGRWKIFEKPDSLKDLKFVFEIKDNKVWGPFLELAKGHYTYGNYYKDSLWTFLSNLKDTTFKIGEWLTYIYALDISIADYYKIPFNNDSIYNELWYFFDGKIAKKRVHKKGVGIIEETFWDYETGNISKRTINKPNYSLIEKFNNDSIAYFSIKQNGVLVSNDFHCPICSSKNCFDFSIYKVKNKSSYNDTLITSVRLDSLNNLSLFWDIKNQIFLTYKKDGGVIIEYINKRGKRKFKILK